jgi:multiple sugar transport system permease protein
VREYLVGYLFVSPWLIGFLAFTLWPFLQSIYLSFTRYNIVAPAKWVGFANYRMLLTQDPLFWHSAWVTIRFALVFVPLGIVVGVALALLLNIDVKGIAVFRTIFYLPSIVPTVATSVLFIWILNPNIGLVNKLLALIGVRGPAWLKTAPWAAHSLVLMALWGVGGSMVIYLAGLKDIPQYLYEAATIDGANALRKMRHITLPMMTPVIFFNLIMGIIGAFRGVSVLHPGLCDRPDRWTGGEHLLLQPLPVQPCLEVPGHGLRQCDGLDAVPRHHADHRDRVPNAKEVGPLWRVTGSSSWPHG